MHTWNGIKWPRIRLMAKFVVNLCVSVTKNYVGCLIGVI
jgi:hypothetical protein